MILLVLAMVLVGGITRLTDSGLSIVDWKPISGIIPPMNDKEWHIEFDHYKNSPEYNKINYGMQLKEFKSIYWLEFWHRFLGRITGIGFILPFIYFIHKKAISNGFIKYLTVTMLTIGLQGFFGWYMVKSGLVDNPHVSHFRLSIHLITAIVIFSMLLVAWLNVNKQLFISDNKSRYTGSIYIILGLLIVQIIYGAFVAGLDAGLIYNTFPLMDGKIIPTLGNIFNDITTVQFIHRYLAKVLLIYTLYICFIKIDKNSNIYKYFLIFLIFLLIQVMLGILTLIDRVPIGLAVLHQLNAVIMVGLVIVLLFISKNNNIIAKK